jgi:hypothetical protein
MMQLTNNDYDTFEALFLDMYPDGVPQHELEDLYRRAYSIGEMIGDFSAVQLADAMWQISQEYDEWLAQQNAPRANKASWLMRVRDMAVSVLFVFVSAGARALAIG